MRWKKQAIQGGKKREDDKREPTLEAKAVVKDERVHLVETISVRERRLSGRPNRTQGRRDVRGPRDVVGALCEMREAGDRQVEFASVKVFKNKNKTTKRNKKQGFGEAKRSLKTWDDSPQTPRAGGGVNHTGGRHDNGEQKKEVST